MTVSDLMGVTTRSSRGRTRACTRTECWKPGSSATALSTSALYCANIIVVGGAMMLEQNDERAVMRRYMTLETIASVCDDHKIQLAKLATL
jgi:hypothetical protein